MSSSSQSLRTFATPDPGHASLGGGVRLALWLVPAALAALLAVGQPEQRRPGAFVGVAVAAALWKGLVSGVRVAAQWERGVILRLGHLQGVRGPGIFYVIPVLEAVRFLDTRTLVLNIPQQKVITRDNVPASIDSAVFFRVSDSSRAITAIQDYRFAIAQYSQAALRDVAGGLSLDELLSERERIQEQVQTAVDSQAHQWGISIESIQLQDIELPEDLKRTMSRQASAEREKRATITKADGDRLAAENLARAAATMAANPIALELRTLQTIDGLGASPSNTVVLFPLELSQTLNAIVRRANERPPS
ncbi:MAG: SPFH domain-containing protein [Cyanobacteriota bacterium]|nr:SPFH domain-containing protein [Cyanobacteriota bacterium]